MRFKDKQHAADFKVAFEKARDENIALKAKQDKKDQADVEAAAKQLESLSVDKPAEATTTAEKKDEAKAEEAKAKDVNPAAASE